MTSMNAFVASLDPKNQLKDYPHAVDFQQQIPVFDGDQLRGLNAQDKAAVGALLAAWRRSVHRAKAL